MEILLIVGKGKQFPLKELEIIEKINEPTIINGVIWGIIDFKGAMKVKTPKETYDVYLYSYKKNYKNKYTEITFVHPYYFIYHRKKTSLFYKKKDKYIFQKLLKPLAVSFNFQPKEYELLMQYKETTGYFLKRLMNFSENYLICEKSGALKILNLKAAKKISLQEEFFEESYEQQMGYRYYNYLPNNPINFLKRKNELIYNETFGYENKDFEPILKKEKKFYSNQNYNLLDNYQGLYIKSKITNFSKGINKKVQYTYILSHLTKKDYPQETLPLERFLVEKYEKNLIFGYLYIDSQRELFPVYERAFLSDNKSGYSSDYAKNTELSIGFMFYGNSLRAYIYQVLPNKHSPPLAKKPQEISYNIGNNHIISINRKKNQEKTIIKIPKDFFLEAKEIIIQNNKGTIKIQEDSVEIFEKDNSIIINPQGINLKGKKINIIGDQIYIKGSKSTKIEGFTTNIQSNSMHIQSQGLLKIATKGTMEMNSSVLINKNKIYLLTTKILIIKSLIFLYKGKMATFASLLISSGVIISGAWTPAVPTAG